MKCRNCLKEYDPNKATADWKGYCSQRCVHAKAKRLGYRKGNPRHTEFHVLKEAGQIGDYHG